MSTDAAPGMLHTNRMLLEPLRAGHLETLTRLFNTREVRRYLWDDNPVGVEHAEELLRASTASFVVNGFGVWACVGTDGACLGCAGLRQVGESDRVELLFAFGQEHWGHGYATEAVQTVLHYAIETLGVGRVEASTHPSNLRSVSLLRKIGMQSSHTEATDAGFLSVYVLTRAAAGGVLSSV